MPELKEKHKANMIPAQREASKDIAHSFCYLTEELKW